MRWRWRWPARWRAGARRAERFARLLDRTGVPDSPAGLDAELVALVGALHQVGADVAGPDEQFRSALRERLVTEAPRVLLPQAPTPPHPPSRHRAPRRRHLLHLAVGVVSTGLIATAGTALASTQALPGQPLYGVKLRIEQVQLSLTWGELGRGERYLEFASTRLGEVTSLVAGAQATSPATAGYVAADLAEQASSIRSGAALLVAAYHRDANPAALRALTTSVADQRTRLAAIMRVMPSQAVPQAQMVSNLLAMLSEQATALVNSCGPPCGAAPLAPPTVASSGPVTGGGVTAVPGGSQNATGTTGGTGAGGASPAAGGPGPGPTPAGTGSGTVGSPDAGITGTLGGTVGGLLSPSPLPSSLPSPLPTTTVPSGLLGGVTGLLMPVTETSSASPAPSTGTSSASTCLLGSTCLP